MGRSFWELRICGFASVFALRSHKIDENMMIKCTYTRNAGLAVSIFFFNLLNCWRDLHGRRENVGVCTRRMILKVTFESFWWFIGSGVNRFVITASNFDRKERWIGFALIRLLIVVFQRVFPTFSTGLAPKIGKLLVSESKRKNTQIRWCFVQIFSTHGIKFSYYIRFFFFFCQTSKIRFIKRYISKF